MAAKRQRASGARTGRAHALDPHSTQSEDLLRRVLATLPGVLYRCRPDRKRTVEFISLGCRTLTGVDPADLVESRVVSYAELVHPDDRARVLEEVERATHSNDPFTLTYRLRRVDGRDVSVREHGCGVRGPSGQVEAIEGIVVEVRGMTERDLTEHAQHVAHDANNVLATIKTTAELALMVTQDSVLADDLAEIVSAAERGAALMARLRQGSQPVPPSTPIEGAE